MNSTAKSLSYQQTGYFSRIITDYLNGNDLLRSFYEHPVMPSGFEAAIRDREKFPTDRALLVKTLKEQYNFLQDRKEVNNNLESLAGANTFTVTTAHQPAIF